MPFTRSQTKYTSKPLGAGRGRPTVSNINTNLALETQNMNPSQIRSETELRPTGAIPKKTVTEDNPLSTNPSNTTVVENSSLSIETSPDTVVHTAGALESSPEFSSITAQQIRQELRHDFRPHSFNQSIEQPSTLQNHDNRPNNVQPFREYVDASIGLAQVTLLRTLTEQLQSMLPQMIAEGMQQLQISNNNQRLNSTPQEEAPINQNNPADDLGPAYSRFNEPEVDEEVEPTQVPISENSRTFYREHINPSFRSNQYVNNVRNNPQYRLDKWGLVFDSSNRKMTIEDFLFRVETLRLDNQCPWSELYKNFHQLLKGDATEWFWTYRRQYKNVNWDHLKKTMLQKYRRFTSDYEIQCKILERRQRNNESMDEFMSAITALKNQLKNEIPESELVRIVKDNLNSSLSSLLFPMRIYCMEQLLDEGRRAERNLEKHADRPIIRNPNYKRVNEISSNESEQESQASYVDVEALQNVTEECWNCHKTDHKFWECDSPQRNIFCYRCGKPDFTTPKCPRCKGNSVLDRKIPGAPVPQKKSQQ